MDQVFPLLDRLETDASWFEALNDFSADFWLDYPGAREHVRVLNLFNVSQYTPLIFAAKDVLPSNPEIVEVLRYCSIISLRFIGVGHRSTHILEEVYNRVAVQLRSGTLRTLRDIRHGLEPVYVTDAEFEADSSALRL